MPKTIYLHHIILQMKLKTSILILILTFAINTAKASLPDIGDNSIFQCVEYEDPYEPGMCFGDIEWVSDRFGNPINNTIVRPKRANNILKRFIKYFRNQRRIANRQGDLDLVDEWDEKISNARQSRQNLRTCFNSYLECSNSNNNNNDNNPTPPSLAEACKVIASPTTEAARNRNSKFNTNFIVNGAACSNSVNSPVVKILNRGSQHCTGTLIKTDVVLTAAHCIEKINCSSLSVENSSGSQKIKPSTCIEHPGYGGSVHVPQRNDVAILLLESAFQNISPVKINTPENSAVVDDLAVFAGYGINENNTDILKATFNYISSVSTEVISTFYRRGNINRGTTCSGDSGGPLFIYKSGEWRTQGTLSDGSALDCALPGTNPNTDTSNWANLTSTSNRNFIKQHVDGVID
jgi:hypothetical protein